jgi:murein DD-endopeptidase MepM/ murein hydrolase activator NlpD
MRARLKAVYGVPRQIAAREAAFSARLGKLTASIPVTDRHEVELAWPATGLIHGHFGDRFGRMHYGIDIAALEGAPITAAAGGSVVLVESLRDYGITTVLAHPGGVTTVYGHQSVTIVRTGDIVRRGEHIGNVGTTGRATGPHLHFEVRFGTVPQDPVGLLRSEGADGDTVRPDTAPTGPR